MRAAKEPVCIFSLKDCEQRVPHRLRPKEIERRASETSRNLAELPRRRQVRFVERVRGARSSDVGCLTETSYTQEHPTRRITCACTCTLTSLNTKESQTPPISTTRGGVESMGRRFHTFRATRSEPRPLFLYPSTPLRLSIRRRSLLASTRPPF